MEVTKSLIAVAISSVLMTSAWTSATAKTAEEDDSVYRWGRWAVLAPAAGNEEVAALPAGINNLGRCESAANCPSPSGSQNIPGEEPGEEPGEPEQPVATSPCVAGAPCGFARIDNAYDPEQNDKPESSEIVPFNLTLDEEAGTVAFVVDQGSENAIQSANVPASIQEGAVNTTTRGGSVVVRGQIQERNPQAALVQGVWENTSNGEGASLNGGEFVWGVAATAGQMQSLISGNPTAVYEGKTLGTTTDNEGSVLLNINFGNATWSGQFDADLSFTASGSVVGSGFVSNASGFSNNIASGEVKGGFVNAGNNAIGGYEVVDTSGIRAADVFNAKLPRPD